MHWQAYSFVNAIRSAFPEQFSNSCVVEFGSSTVNYSIRDVFDDPKMYIGIDLAEGKNVDVIANAKDVFVGDHFDIAISCECFEHNPYYKETFLNMCNHTRKGGLVIFTCATVGRKEHGTARTSPEESPGSQKIGWDYYQNLIENDFEELNYTELFEHYSFYTNKSSRDLYFVGLRKGETPNKHEKFNYLQECHEILSSLSFELELAWSDKLNADNILDRINEILIKDISIFNQQILQSYIVKVIEGLNGNIEKLESLVGILHSTIFYSKKSSDIYRQIYLVNKALKNYKSAFHSAKKYFKKTFTPISLFFYVESIFLLEEPILLKKTIIENLRLINFNVDVSVRTQILGYFISAFELNSNINTSIVDHFIDKKNESLLHFAFTGKIITKNGNMQKAIEHYREIDKKQIPEKYSWISTDIDNCLNKFKEINK